jgi:hypothetical protein
MPIFKSFSALLLQVIEFGNIIGMGRGALIIGIRNCVAMGRRSRACEISFQKYDNP